MPAQVMFFAAAVVEAAGVAVIPAITEGSYASVHCSAAGSLPAGDVSVRVKVALAPCIAEAVDNANIFA